MTAYDGTPSAECLVDFTGASRTSTRRMLVKADNHGEYEASALESGDYVVTPYIEETDSRYPGGTSSFFDPSPLRFTLNDHELTTTLNIHLGVPNRILTGQVTSASNGAPVATTIQIDVSGDPYRFIRFSSTQEGAIRVLVPPQTPLELKTTAPGYKVWSQPIGPYDNQTDPHLEIRLTPEVP